MSSTTVIGSCNLSMLGSAEKKGRYTFENLKETLLSESALAEKVLLEVLENGDVRDCLFVKEVFC